MKRTLIKNGFVIDPANQVQAQLNILVEGGKIAEITTESPEADEVIDAAGKIVTPGFIDIHMHEDPVTADGTIYSDEEKAIFPCMLRMGVTTAIAGQCGENRYHPADYLDIVDRDGAATNVAILAGHGWFREEAGHMDKYSPVTEEELAKMTESMQKAVDRGCLGVSYGIRYIPGIDERELKATAAVRRKDGKWIAAHIRSDAEEVYDAAKEFLDIAKDLKLSVELSHIGSMAGFGQMTEFLRMVDTYKMNGVDASCDCYPYYAFSTSIGSTTYDDGWLDRYQCGYDVVEMCEGTYKGQRLTKETFDEVRRETPEFETICYVMKDHDVDLAFNHPNVMLASDGIFSSGQGHPRAAGAFPRLLAEFVRPGKLSMYEAIRMMTAMPAEKAGLKNKGRLNVNADADIVIFDPETVRDNATFENPILPPTGISYVLIGGEIAAKDGNMVQSHLGRSVRK
ncbi:MAG: amidohydrolase family protein [Firmicutes bacterium]|nr:amidohydrolase family protein [Bacillota bacterium]